MALMAPEPPSALPLGYATGPASAWLVVTSAQSAGEPRFSGHAFGTAMARVRRERPASRSSTRASGCPASRAASTQPAVPAPTTT